jgi:hypothetical protein
MAGGRTRTIDSARHSTGRGPCTRCHPPGTRSGHSGSPGSCRHSTSCPYSPFRPASRKRPARLHCPRSLRNPNRRSPRRCRRSRTHRRTPSCHPSPRPFLRMRSPRRRGRHRFRCQPCPEPPRPPGRLCRVCPRRCPHHRLRSSRTNTRRQRISQRPATHSPTHTFALAPLAGAMPRAWIASTDAPGRSRS